MAERGQVINVPCVIEPQPNALIGAWLLRQSLREHALEPVNFWLTVVRRDGSENSILEAAAALGMRAAGRASPHANPFLNKWLWLDAFKQLRRARWVAMMDWDMLLVSPSSFPAPSPGKIAARPNPAGLYKKLLRRMPHDLFPWRTVRGTGRIPSSLNGGLLVSGGALLSRCAKRTITLESEIAAHAAGAELWEREQLALSIAVGETGFADLPPEWNVTWRKRKLQQRVRLWHYSDASETMRKLKRTLHRPEWALGCLRDLRSVHPEAVACFLRFYSQAIEQHWFHKLTRIQPPNHAAKTQPRSHAEPPTRVALGR